MDDNSFNLGSSARKVLPSVVEESDGALEVYVVERLCRTRKERGLLSRLQAMSVWFIETSEQTDAFDTRWTLYVGMVGQQVASFCTVFNFFNPLQGSKPYTWRVCQFCTLPMHQRKGYGKKVLEMIYYDARSSNNVYEITVEDPCADFVRLRDVVDLEMCLEGHVFNPHSKEFRYDLGIVPKAEIKKIRDETLLCSRQIQRVYDILYWMLIKDNGEDAIKEYRLNIKRRFVHEDIEGVATRTDRKEALGLLYDDLMKGYEAVICRANSRLLDQAL